MSAAPLFCGNCCGGLVDELREDGLCLVCERCEARVAGPFVDANEIPTYVAAPGRMESIADVGVRDVVNLRSVFYAAATTTVPAGFFSVTRRRKDAKRGGVWLYVATEGGPTNHCYLVPNGSKIEVRS